MTETTYIPQDIESRWQAWWTSHHSNKINPATAANPYYNLMMFPYPSAEGLHVGNVYAFTGADIHGRYQRLRGNTVFEPMGFDAFGIHSENYAMKVGTHPMKLIPANIANFRRQLRMMGFMFDWDHEVDTTSPEYYRWTQWIFLQLFKGGLAYRAKRGVYWCPACMTVLASEQVIDGCCERHPDTRVEKRDLEQWFFRITAYAQRLLDNLGWLDWSDVVKLGQAAWIGRSEGAEIDFDVADHPDHRIRVFTTRPDTLFGATYMVLAPEHPLVETLAHPSALDAVRAYRDAARLKEEIERLDLSKEKTGVFLGAYAVNPVNQAKIPIWISDYVLMEYGTGAIMAVPAHDQRDWEFATKFNLPIIQVIRPLQGEPPADCAYIDDGAMMNSGEFDAMPSKEGGRAVVRRLEAEGRGKATVNYRLRDWCISRQRYWGPPIPMIHCERCGIVPVPESDLPVLLPETDDFRPDQSGRAPLARIESFVKTTCPKCSGPARRETDVSDNFLDSAWYFIRYLSARDGAKAWDPELVSRWLPVTMYIGGKEHTVLHLMYTRFLCMALSDLGLLKMGERPGVPDAGEPFSCFRAHGLLIKDGNKMSKSRGNVVNPDAFVHQYGADTLRMYLMFLGPFERGGDFRDKDIAGVQRFLERVWRWYFEDPQPVDDAAMPRPALIKLHQTIKKVGADLASLSYNTAIAALMELHNTLKPAPAVSRFAREAFALMLAPLAPHLAEELWSRLGNKPSIFNARWPEYDPALTVEDVIELAVQVNGKLRDRFSIAADADEQAVRAAALQCPRVIEALGDKQPLRVIIVPKRLVNVIIK